MSESVPDPRAEHRRRKARRALLTDFKLYAEKCLKIRTKDAEIRAFLLNSAQMILHNAVEQQLRETGKIRVIILKGRQQGLSTYVGGRIFSRVSQDKARKGMVVAHKSDSTETLFEMTKRYYEKLPEIVKPSKKYSSRRELSFDKLDSSYTVATAGGDGIARGETITDLHASELAFWAASTARENWNGLEAAIPDAPGTSIWIESTANGASGLFYDLWKGAVAGTNGFLAVFIPWFLTPEYRTPVPEGFERTPDEVKLAAQFPLDDEQLYWRRLRIARNGLDLFRQEYPCTPDEAFLTSGRPVFNPEKLQQRLNEIEAPTEYYALEEDTFVSHPRGELRVFVKPQSSGTYTIGGDVGSGIRGARKANGEYERDPSVLQVLDERKNQVAVWRGYVEPDFFATVAACLGYWYNVALIGIESNNHGILTNNYLAKVLLYPYVHQSVQVDKTTDKETTVLGFQTTSKSKTMIVNELRAAQRLDEMTLNDPTTINEMLVFVEDESGKFAAEPGSHDDTVIALAIANHIHEDLGEMIEPEDDHYTEGY